MMKQIYLLKCFLVCCVLTVLPSVVVAQPSWVKKASKAVFSLKTFSADGTLLGTSTGFFVSHDGDAVGCFAPFKGAARAVVFDAGGKEHEVDYMLGANGTYDVAKFHVDIKKSEPLALATAQQPEGTSVWLMPYRDTKRVTSGKVRKTETFNTEYHYYTLALPMNDEQMGAPLMNEAGEVIGLMQPPMTAADTLNYAVSARFADSLSIGGLSINDQTLRQTAIKKALPEQESQALLTLYVAASSLDSASYVQLLDDFIAKFPESSDGYVYRAQVAANGLRYGDADRDMEQALKVAPRQDEVHYSYSRMICQSMLTQPQAADRWSLDKALEEAETAWQQHPLAVYRQQKGFVLYAQKKYDEAYNAYEEVFDSLMLQPDLYYEAARCKLLVGDTVAHLALLDKVMDTFSKPYLKEAAPYLLVRAQANLEAANYRKAVTDLNDYEQLMKAQVNDRFYYIRFQAEMGGRLFQQALNDINEAIRMKPDDDLYYAEKASLEVRVGYYDEAISTASECIRLAPDHSDGYLFLGLAQCLKGQKAEGVQNLQKAKELGDPQADALIEKYQ
ncbi:MAG: trypsin-like peptidase domain-containing protein [Prevotella sp.]|nr:trypsin-like peptidase domain-containing protein [Prevotella sp.]